MRWNMTRIGCKRRKRGFLLFPKLCLHPTQVDWRWLEFAEWEEEYRPSGSMGAPSWECVKWLDIELEQKPTQQLKE